MGNWYRVCVPVCLVGCGYTLMPAAGVGVLSWPEIALVDELFKR